nr:hypothetical protein [Cellvibrio fontiphilus]
MSHTIGHNNNASSASGQQSTHSNNQQINVSILPSFVNAVFGLDVD